MQSQLFVAQFGLEICWEGWKTIMRSVTFLNIEYSRQGGHLTRYRKMLVTLIKFGLENWLLPSEFLHFLTGFCVINGCRTALSQAEHCREQCWVNLNNVMDSAESELSIIRDNDEPKLTSDHCQKQWIDRADHCKGKHWTLSWTVLSKCWAL